MGKKQYHVLKDLLKELYKKSINTEDEGAYNASYLKDPYGVKKKYLVLDKIIIYNIELCDILRWTKNTLYLYHVKEKFGQQTRDVCSQILHAATVMRGALSTRQPKNYLEDLWSYLENSDKESSQSLKDVKHQRHSFTKQTFMDLFLSRKIVFVYAYLPKANQSFFDELNKKDVTSTLKGEEGEEDLIKMLIRLGYLDRKKRLTGTFLFLKKEDFKLEKPFEENSSRIFDKLDKFRSSF